VDESIGIYYAPLTADYVVNGKLTFGGADSSAYVGKLKYTNLTTTYLSVFPQSPLDRLLTIKKVPICTGVSTRLPRTATPLS
jgi:hypothetical protein